MPDPAAVDPPSPVEHGADRATRGQDGQRRRAIRNAVIGFAVIAVLLVCSYFLPLPSVNHVRQWGEHLGPAFVAVFFGAYAVITVGPVPRTPFTVMSGVFFGPIVGLAGAMVASSVAALLAFLLARRLGRDRVQPFLRRPVLRAIEYRLSTRGWLAVGSLRLIPACPFSVTNYAAGLSSVRPLPYLVASVIGMAPGTAAVVLLGDALTGRRDPLLLLLSGCFFAVGVAGLILDARLPARGQATGLDTQ
ncbi:TVP38/TMEM64 family protein [Gordonia sinesedis]